MTWGIKSPGLPDSRRHLAPLNKIARARSVHCVILLLTVGFGVSYPRPSLPLVKR